MDPSKNPYQNDESSNDNNNSNIQSFLAPIKDDEIEGLNFTDDEDLLHINGVINGKETSAAEEKFDMSIVHKDEALPDTRNFDERDYISHRRESFPHHPQLSRNVRKKLSSASKILSPEDFSMLLQDVVTNTNNNEEGEKLETVETDSSIPITSNSSKQDFSDLMETPKKEVKFEIGGMPLEYLETGGEESHKRRKHRKSHDHGTKIKNNKDHQQKNENNRISIDSDTDRDRDEITSHRFEDHKFRRHKFFPKAEEDQKQDQSKNGKYDHTPHEVFVEMDILSDGEWKEAARWIKYEEDFEEEGNRWGKAHISSLKFHSLINLKRLIENGVLLLDLEEKDLPGVAYRIVDQMVIKGLIESEHSGQVMREILLKHKHVNEHEKIWKFPRKNTGSLSSLNNFDEKTKERFLPSNASLEPELLMRRNSAISRLVPDTFAHFRSNGGTDTAISISQEETNVLISPNSEFEKSKKISEEDLKWFTSNDSILRRIPNDAEASIVLVGKSEDSLKGPVMSIVRLADSVLMPNITECPIPVRFLFILLGPSSSNIDYKEIGRCISTLLKNKEFHDIAYKGSTRKDFLKGIHDFLNDSIVLPPMLSLDNELFPFEDLVEKSKEKQKMTLSKLDEIDGKDPIQTRKPVRKPLVRTGKLFGGVYLDIKERYAHYLSDFKDGFDLQCLATIFFIWLASLAGGIAFGGIYGEKTENHIGISETLITTSFAGIIFSLFSGQPLIIIGATGPLLLFDESLYQFCSNNNFDYLAIRLWIGVWLGILGLVFSCFEGSTLVKFFTRFTQEIFAALISLLFIAESFTNLFKIFKEHPLLSEYDKDSTKGQPNTALLSMFLMIGTFLVAFLLKEFRNSSYLTATIRKAIGNFSVPLALIIMVLIDFGIEHTATQKLNIPDGFSNSNSTIRTWMIEPSNVGATIAFLSIFPAMLVFILIFMEVSICELIIGKKEQKLKKGEGFHLDVLLLSLINVGAGCFGGPFICAATIRATTHATSLQVFSTNNPPGEKPSIIGAKEQRVTSLVVSILIGLSVLMGDVLAHIPLAVIFGIFLFMGVSSMTGNQFFERVALLFKQVENHPSVPYVRKLRTWKMNLFSLIQVQCIVLLWVVKLSIVALIFPFLLLLLIPFRYFILTYIFSSTELNALDNSGGEILEESTEEQNSSKLFELKNDKLSNVNGIQNLEADEIQIQNGMKKRKFNFWFK